MLVLELAYEGEQNFIEDIQNLVRSFKEEGIAIGISESIQSNTHFIKIFCDDNYNDGMKSKVYVYVSNIIYEVIIDYYRRREMLEYLTENYFFLKHDEIMEVDERINNILSFKEKVEGETSIYCLNRINNIIDGIKTFIEENEFINVTGYLNFRMKGLVSNIQMIIDKVIEQYMAEKEYNEFIKLLKYFVDIQECKIEELYIIVDEDKKYKIKDGYGQDIFKDFINEISENKDADTINIEDIIISGLITNSPRNILFYNSSRCDNKEFINTIRSVFGDRVTFIEEQDNPRDKMVFIENHNKH